MWHSYLFGAITMIRLVLGFTIAVSVGLTGIGGGSFTVPALLLIAGLPPAEAVGTTFVYAGVLRLVVGMLALRMLATENNNAVIVLVVGLLLTISSSVSFVPRAQVPGFAR